MRQQFTEDYGAKYPWKLGGTITTEQALLAGATGLTHAAVEALAAANKVIITVPDGWSAMELRFYSDAAADIDDIVELYAHANFEDSAGNGVVDHYRHFARLTIVVSAQVYGSYKFHNTVTPADEAWITAADEVKVVAETFGSYVFNTHGHNKILVIASDLDSTLIGVEYRRL